MRACWSAPGCCLSIPANAGNLPSTCRYPFLVQLNLEDPKATVSVVGDTHGQFHDVCKL